MADGPILPTLLSLFTLPPARPRQQHFTYEGLCAVEEEEEEEEEGESDSWLGAGEEGPVHLFLSSLPFPSTPLCHSYPFRATLNGLSKSCPLQSHLWGEFTSMEVGRRG